MVASRRQQELDRLRKEGVVGQQPQEGNSEGLPGEVVLTAPPIEFPVFSDKLPEGEPIATGVKVPVKTENKSRPKPRGSASDREAADIEESLEDKLTQIFGLASPFLPKTAVYATENCEKATAALISIGKRRPAVMKALRKIADGADATEILQYTVGIGVAVGCDLGRFEGDELICQVTGVTKVLDQYFTDDDSESVNHNVTAQAVPNALKFSAVPAGQ